MEATDSTKPIAAEVTRQDPELTVVMPVYNRQQLLTRALDSLWRQHVKPQRVIVVDNGSTDESLAVARRWADEHRSALWQVDVVSEPSRGASVARNRGLALATTPYITFLDSDDEFAPEHVERILDRLRRRPGLDIVYYDRRVIDFDGWSEVKSVNDDNVMRGHLLHASLATHSYTVSTRLLREAGGWNESLGLWDDLELGVRLLLRNPVIEKIQGNPTVLIHPTDESITGTMYSDKADQIDNVFALLRSHLSDPSHPEWLTWLDAKRAAIAGIYMREGAKESSQKLLDNVLAGYSGREALKMQLVYLTVRYLGHGGATLTVTLWPGPAGEKIKTGKRSIFGKYS